ncbi:MAG: hypothetical protein WC294_09215 [Methanoregula sp.]|jgi:hypothetical protein
MTAEIVIMNKEAVALAADSAVSLVTGPAENPQKIFTSANKIFRLPNNHTVAFMIFNNAAFLGIPWEPLITRFGDSLGPAPLPNLSDYADRFLGFLKSEQELITADIEKQYFTSLIYAYYLSLRQIFQQNSLEIIRVQGVISEDQIGDIVAEKINEIYAQIMSAEPVSGIDQSRIRDLSKAYDEITTRVISEVFEQLPIPDPTRAQLKEIPFMFFGKYSGSLDPMVQNFSGMVIAGFGEKEIFPSLVTYAIEGRLSGALKYKETENKKITLESGAYVIPFAQREMVDIFMSGIDPRLTDALVESLSEIFRGYPQAIVDSIETMNDDEKSSLKTQFQPQSDVLIERISTYIDNYRASNIGPVINVVISLPKTELAAMAESLVNLTSLKRKVSLQAETVGGPVDVAVLSKRDGFVWIKKKHYFKEELNLHMVQRV